ncbi:hypothetical protein A2960_00695 [Candidatus Gottesmanbacteria bacterium RIFCSPLOWO2_01_FULL_39_12b]|uniref:Glycosyltransferase RgtA/B/C/D-like domain-containing protein n=1 Tax=Candidatus Gottesmanbacteria bacterium RIFCSPLOWO2_01_FULL_39_12b TaxID=1798388 RepID=A0A1F6APR4_9BACT|nr:MAG: hypothetical protein A2960_00695 [Candidatus Gottesmanbacteria bacterium RIFCSPLOWO2_01_FULL_39_12b]
MTKNYFLFGCIIALAILLRFFYLGKVPPGLYSDEASYGYNAYSIIKTGKDEYGQFLPLAFKSFGDYKAPLYIYALTPFVSIFNLSEISVRLPSAVLGVILVIVVYFLAEEIFTRNSYALLCSYFISILPFGLQFNRMAHENNLVVVLITVGILFFLISVKYGFYIIPSFISFLGSIYTYHDAKVFTPLILVSLIILLRKSLWKNRANATIGIFITVILLLPFISTLKYEALWSRVRYTNILSDKGITLETNQERGEDQNSKFFVPALFHNKILNSSKKFLENYISQYSFLFLFFTGDPVKLYQTPGNGLFYPVTLIFLLLGAYFLFKRNMKYKWLITIWFILSGIPPALTRFVPSASRMLSLLPAATILIVIGLLASSEYIKSPPLKRKYFIFVTCIFTLSIAYYLHYYYFNMSVRYAKEWHYGMKEVMSKERELESQYARIWFSKNAWGYIYPLFYLPYPPEKYQPQASLSSLDEFGFGWVNGFDKYTFSDFPSNFSLEENTLFIGAPSDFSLIKKPLYTVYYPDRQVAFYFADKNSF